MERFFDAIDCGWQSKVDLSATTVVVPSEGTKHIGGCCHMKRLEGVYVELGLYGFSVNSFIHVGLFVAMQVGL